MGNLGKRKTEANQDGSLTELHEDVVKRIKVVLGAVAEDYIDPKLTKQKETLIEKIDQHAKDFKKLWIEQKQRLDLYDQDHEVRFGQADNKQSELSTQNDMAQVSIDHLKSEFKRLETLLQQQAKAATVAEAKLGRLNSRMVGTRRVLWLLAVALAASFFLILKRP